jgi:excisionase family DNA binding protein
MSAETSIAPTVATDDSDRLWTVQEAARFLAVSESWVYTATRTGVLPAIRLGRVVRFDQAALRAWVRGERGGRVVQLPRCR